MKSRSRILPTLAASACVMVLGVMNACDRPEAPTETGTATIGQPSMDPSAPRPLPEGRPATPAEVARLMAERAKSGEPVASPDAEGDGQSHEPAPLAKSAAEATCVVDFNQSFGLSLMPDQCYSTFAVSPYYSHLCNNQYYVYTKPINLDHFHLAAENPNYCFGTSPKWGTWSNGVCVNQSEAKYWPRRASNMGTNTGINFLVKGPYPGYVRKNFNLGAIYAVSGTLDLYAYRVGVGWWHWPNLTSPQRWYWTGNNLNISEISVYHNGLNGTMTFDNLEISIIP